MKSRSVVEMNMFERFPRRGEKDNGLIRIVKRQMESEEKNELNQNLLQTKILINYYSQN